MKFYTDRTVEEQRARLPQQFQGNYNRTQLDRIEIDGNVIHGYFEYSFLDEKSHIEQPTRASDGSIENINSYVTFLTPRLIIRYNMMHIDDYRKLMILLQSKNEFEVTFYDIVWDERVTHKMYFAPTQMPMIYQQYLMAMGVQNFEIELIGTNNENVQLNYDYQFPGKYKEIFRYSGSHDSLRKNSSFIVGETANFTYEGKTYKVSSQEVMDLMNNEYTFMGWNTKEDGSGVNFIDGNEYFINRKLTLHAIWG